jgi:hypothetical protein
MNIQNEELNYEKQKVISLFGTKLDIVTLIIFTGGILLSIFIWTYFGLYNYKNNRYFLLVLCLFLVTQIFSSGIYAGSYSVEDNEIKEIVQLNAVMFSSLIILIAFQNNNYSEQDNKMLVIALVLSLLALMYYNTPKSSSAKRIIRKMKNVFMTISIFVFMNMLYNLGCNKFGLLSESK